MSARNRVNFVDEAIPTVYHIFVDGVYNSNSSSEKETQKYCEELAIRTPGKRYVIYKVMHMYTHNTEVVSTVTRVHYG
jgi:hypothetical protein